MKIKTGMTALVVSLPILMSPPALADIYTPGIDLCKRDPVACGIVVATPEYAETHCKQQGNPCGIDLATPEYAKNYCKQQGNPCGIELATVGYKKAEDYCKGPNNPCGIVVDTSASRQEGWNKGKQAGIDHCKNNPELCGLERPDGSETDGITKGIEQGKQLCLRNPQICGITADLNDGSTEVGIQRCQNDPKYCKLEKEGSKAEGKAEGQKEAESSFWNQLLSLPSVGTDKTEEDIRKECGETDLVSCSFEKGKAEGKKEAESSSMFQLLSLPAFLGTDKTEEDISNECGEKDPVSCSFEKGKTEGIISCQNDPDSCQLEEKWSFEKGKTEGITGCQTDPDSCNLEEKWSFSKGKTEGYAEGQEATEASYQAQLLSVIDEQTDDIDENCQNYPISCSFEKGKVEAKADCKDNPASCGINVNQATALAITQTQTCQEDTSNSVCGELNKNKNSPYVFLSLPTDGTQPFGILYIPRLKVEIDEKKAEIYQKVYLTWVPTDDGSVLFQWVPADETPTETPTNEPTTETEEETTNTSK